MNTLIIDSRETKRIKSATKYYTKQGLDVSVDDLCEIEGIGVNIANRIKEAVG